MTTKQLTKQLRNMERLLTDIRSRLAGMQKTAVGGGRVLAETAGVMSPTRARKILKDIERTTFLRGLARLDAVRGGSEHQSEV